MDRPGKGVLFSNIGGAVVFRPIQEAAWVAGRLLWRLRPQHNHDMDIGSGDAQQAQRQRITSGKAGERA
jgi:hypothetical protein